MGETSLRSGSHTEPELLSVEMINVIIFYHKKIYCTCNLKIMFILMHDQTYDR